MEDGVFEFSFVESKNGIGLSSMDNDSTIDTVNYGVKDKYYKEANTPPVVNIYANVVAFDSHKEGIHDYLYKCCPLTNDEFYNNGCPYDQNIDSDGVIDKTDRFPDEKGEVANFGCSNNKVRESLEVKLKELSSKLKFSRVEGNILKNYNVLLLDKIWSFLNKYKAISV